MSEIPRPITMPKGPALPHRCNLVSECTRVLLQRINQGEWPQKLPGERRLAEILQVGRDTIRLTLQALEREGTISPPQPGSQRHILHTNPTPKRQTSRKLRIGLLAHQTIERLPQPMLLEIDFIRRALADRGGSLEAFSPGWYEQAQPQRRLQAFIASEPCDAWILLRSSAAIQTWFQQSRTPCLIRGYPHPSITLPHLDVDWQATAHHAAAQLWRHGHRHILLLRPPAKLSGVDAAILGLQQFPEPGFHPIVATEDGTAQGIARILQRSLRLHPTPTAIVATRARQAATTLTWLATSGIRIPQQISLISLAREPFLEHLLPEISGYHTEPEAVARLVIRRLHRLTSSDWQTTGNTWINPTFFRGQSLAHAP